MATFPARKVQEWGDGLLPDLPIRVPQAFWWQGPQGGRVLHWLNEHYMLGNVLGVSSNTPFGADKTRYFLETDGLINSKGERLKLKSGDQIEYCVEVFAMHREPAGSTPVECPFTSQNVFTVHRVRD